MKRVVGLTVLAGSPALLASCGGDELSCDEGLSEADVAQRKRAGYLARSPEPSRRCGGCENYHARFSDWVCGACAVVKGPIDPLGVCEAWQKRTS